MIRQKNAVGRDAGERGVIRRGCVLPVISKPKEVLIF